jgi:spermidine/putrescine transport system permease protein
LKIAALSLQFFRKIYVDNKGRDKMERVTRYIAKHPHIPYVGPISLWTLFFIIGPIMVIFYYSFLQVGPMGETLNTFTLDHYRALLDPNYFVIMMRTIFYAFLANVTCLLIGYPLAYWIVNYGGRWKTLFVLLVILPSWTCYLIRIYALKTIIAHNGIINGFLIKYSIISTPIEILYTPYAVVIGLIFTWLPFMVLPIYASLEGLDPSCLEASLDLGATPMERFFTITLPMTKGGIFAGTILVFIPALGEWLIPALLGGAKVMMAGNLVTLHFITAGNIPRGSSIAATLTTMIILIIYLCLKMGGEETLEKIT